MFLTRDIVSEVYPKTTLQVVTLPEGSFFGELPMILGINTFFNLMVGPKDKKLPGERLMRDGKEQSLIYELEDEKFKDICTDYPEFKTMVYIRGEIRIAYFKHLTMLRQGEFGYNMKILEIEREIDEEREKLLMLDLPEKEKNLFQNTQELAREQAKLIIAKKLVLLRKKVTIQFGPKFAEDVVQCLINRVMIIHEGVKLLDPTKPAE